MLESEYTHLQTHRESEVFDGETTSSEPCAICQLPPAQVWAVKKCRDCGDNLCQGCVEAHKRTKLTKSHVLVPLQSAAASAAASRPVAPRPRAASEADKPDVGDYNYRVDIAPLLAARPERNKGNPTRPPMDLPETEETSPSADSKKNVPPVLHSKSEGDIDVKGNKGYMNVTSSGSLRDITILAAKTCDFDLQSGFDSELAKVGRLALSLDQKLLYGTDPRNKLTKGFNHEGQEVLTFLDGDLTAAAEPSSIAVLRNGNVVVGYWNAGGLIKIFSSEGHFLSELKTPSQELPFVAQNSSLQLIVSCYNTGNLFMCDSKGALIKTINSTPSLKFPIHIHIDQMNQIYVSDKDKAVHAYSPQGLHKFCYRGSDRRYKFTPNGICTDSDYNILVADKENHRVHLVSQEGKFLNYLVTAKDGIKWPRDIVITEKKKLLVGHFKGKVTVFDYSTKVDMSG